MKFSALEEKAFLDSLVKDYTDKSPYSKVKKDIIHSMMDEHIKKASSKSVLQLGCSNGYETKYLARKFKQVDVIDGSKKFIEEIKKDSDIDNCDFILSLFEDYNPKNKKYDYIFCNYVLEHVFDSLEVLKNVKTLLKERGKIFVTVPNATAFSRILASQIGFIDDLYALTENDVAHGHRRVYDIEKLKKDFHSSGYEILDKKGVIFKIMADFQLNKMFQHEIITEAHVWGLQRMANDNEEYCDSIFIVGQ